MNFTETLLNNGFISWDRANKKPIDCYAHNGWLGCTTYCPDIYLIKDNKSVSISLNGVLVNDGEESPTYQRMMAKMQEPGYVNFSWIDTREDVKYIRMVNNGITIYESWFGEIPSQEILNDFING